MQARKHIATALILLMLIGTASAATSVSQFGITWVFDKELATEPDVPGTYQYGTFVNGDYWVVGPVTVTNVSPEPSSGRHGSMINPMTGRSQGYDDRIANYDSSLSVSFPKTLQPGESLVSTESLTGTDCSGGNIDLMGRCVSSVHAYLKNAAVLTVLASVPPADSFRPPFVGSEKPVYTISQLQRQIFPNLAKVASTPPLATYERYLQRPWLNHQTDWQGRFMHPTQNMPNYYREAFMIYSTVPLLLSLNFTDQEKEALLIRFVQLGIDQYATILNGDGDKMIGRGPIALVGLLLNDPGMVSYSYGYREVTTYYYDDPDLPEWMNSEGRPVEPGTLGAIKLRGELGWTGATVLWRNKIANPYEHIHPSEWRSVYTGGVGPEGACKHDGYRFCCFSHTYVGEALAGHIIPGLKGAWNHPAFFDYIDRWMTEDVPWSVRDATCGSSWITFMEKSPGSTFIGEMWDAYREFLECETASDCRNDYQCKTLEDCIGNQCVYNDLTGSCDDGDPCTTGDTCSSGTCTGIAKDCNDGIACTDDSCSAGICQNTPQNSLCGTSTACITYTCNAATGCQTTYNTGAACDDGIPCTEGDACDAAGNCLTGTPNDNLCPDYPDCLTKTCNATTGCQYTPVGCNTPPNLVSWLRFERNTLDETGTNNGTFHGGTANYVTGKVWQALEFDGLDDYVDLGSDSSIDNIWDNGGGSFMAWVYPETIPTDARIFSKGADISNLVIETGAGIVGFRSTTYPGTETTTGINTGEWTHIAVTYDNSGMLEGLKIYFNGEQQPLNTTIPGVINDASANLIIGSENGTRRYFNGKIDEARIYNRALTSEEILALYNEASQECVGTPKLLNYISQWKQGQITMLALMQRIAQWKAGC